MRVRVVASPFRLFGVLLALVLAAASAQPILAAQSPGSKQGTRNPSADPASLERHLIAATRREPPSADAFHALAAFYIRHRRLEAAIPHLERAQAIDANHAASGYDLAVALLETGRLEDSRRQVQRMLKARESAELLNLLGDVEERAGNLTAAAEMYQRAAHAEASEEHLFDWGNNLIQLRAFGPAVEVFTAAIARHPTSARLHVGLGIAEYSQGQYEQAVKSFCAAADLAPLDPRPYQFLGEMYGVAPDHTGEVTKRLARFARSQPRNAMAQFYSAMSLWKGQPGALAAADAKRVEGLLRRAVALDPKMAKGFVELGILLLDQQRYADAIVALRRAIELQPDHAQAHYRLAQAYRRTGQHAQADEELQIFERLTRKPS